MRSAINFLLVMFFVSMLSDATAYATDIRQGEKVTIVTPQVIARLCPFPECGQEQHITRIPQGTVLEIDGIMQTGSKAWPVLWFDVTFKDKRGWISIFDTDKQPGLLRNNKKSTSQEDLKAKVAVTEKNQEINRLEEIVRKIPASKAGENLHIYTQLVALDPDNVKYKEKVAFYKNKLADNSSNQNRNSSPQSKKNMAIRKQCPGTKTLSGFVKAMTASANHQDLVVGIMRSEGEVIIIESGTRGEIAQKQTLPQGWGVVRFIFPGNPNGFYGIWTFENCFD
jgi:hypothetical protein